MKTKLKKSSSLQLEPKMAIKAKMNLERELRSKSSESQRGRGKSVIEGHEFSRIPSPLDFETFLPWICKEWQCPKTVIITKATQDPYKKKDHRSSSSRSRYQKIMKLKHDETETGARSSKETSASNGIDGDEPTLKPMDQDYLVVNAVYDTKGNLVEVAIMRAIDVPPVVIKALGLCLPYHALFTKLKIIGGGVSSPLLLEIAALLRPSNITDVNLENCFVPQGNFYILLEQISRLKHLWLSGCQINDIVCYELVSRIEFGAPCSSLLILDLGSNCITDAGAKRIGQVLRLNRSLLHLNLSNNKITDVGAAALLSSLAEFPLTVEEVIDKSQRKFEYARNKIVIYKNCLEEAMRTTRRFDVESYNVRLSKTKPTKKEQPNKKKSPENVTNKTAAQMAEKMTAALIGEFVDPFDSKGIQMKNDLVYGVGNLILCSLNLSYNMITYETIKKIYEVLKYQQRVFKEKPQTGLLRVLFDGNNIPLECIEYQKIEELLKIALKVDLSEQTKSPVTSAIMKKVVKSSPIHK